MRFTLWISDLPESVLSCISNCVHLWIVYIYPSPPCKTKTYPFEIWSNSKYLYTPEK